MRWFLIALFLLAACQNAPSTADVDGSALAVDEISVTSLDSPAAVTAPDEGTAPDGAAANSQTSTAETPDVATDPETDAPPADEVAPPEEAAPEAPKPAAQILCEKSGGQWAVAGESGAFACVKPTRDGGKSCKKEGDCQGMCLARSGTCAPFMPLFGCNEVLEKDGRRVTLCIE